jgi:hypothetical protein
MIDTVKLEQGENFVYQYEMYFRKVWFRLNYY